MATDRKRLKALLSLASLAADRCSAELQAKRAEEHRLAAQMAALDHPSVAKAGEYNRFEASGAALLWRSWQIQEQRRLNILTARARIAADAAQRKFSKAEARRQVLQRLVEQEGGT